MDEGVQFVTNVKSKNILKVEMGFKMIALASKHVSSGRLEYYVNYSRAYLAYKVENTWMSKWLSKHLDKIQSEDK